MNTPTITRENAYEIQAAYEARPEPPADVLDHATFILSEWLNDRAPLGEGRYRDPARALLKFASLLTPQLKPLIWSTVNPYRYQADSPVGTYSISQHLGETLWMWELSGKWIAREFRGTIEEARAAAEADLASRILPCLAGYPENA